MKIPATTEDCVGDKGSWRQRGEKSLCSMVHRLNRWADRCRAGQSGLMVQRWTMVWRSLFDNPCTEIAACPQLICLMSLALCSLINWKNRPFAPLPSLQELATWLSAKEQRIHLGEVQIGGKKKPRHILIVAQHHSPSCIYLQEVIFPCL